MTDKYANFAALKAAEPANAFCVSLRDVGSPIVVVAPHGGGIEWGTSEVALAIAGSELSYYLFEGNKGSGNKALHITSSNFDEPTGIALMRSASVVLTIHGEGSEGNTVYLGGLNTAALSSLRSVLTQGGYEVRDHTNPELQGKNKWNICNVGRKGSGVQLELAAGLRGSFFASRTRAGRRKPTAKLFEFGALVNQAMRENAL